MFVLISIANKDQTEVSQDAYPSKPKTNQVGLYHFHPLQCHLKPPFHIPSLIEKTLAQQARLMYGSV